MENYSSGVPYPKVVFLQDICVCESGIVHCYVEKPFEFGPFPLRLFFKSGRKDTIDTIATVQLYSLDSVRTVSMES